MKGEQNEPATELDGDDQKWSRWYVFIVEALIKNYREKRFEYSYLSFTGWDVQLQFDREAFPDDFGIKNAVYVLPARPGISHHATVTMKISDESFIVAEADGTYFGLLEPSWAERVNGDTDPIVQQMVRKVRGGYQ